MDHTLGLTSLGRRGGLIIVVMAGAALMSGCQAGQRHASRMGGDVPVRAIWVTRWDYKSADDISRVMENCRRAGFNTILFQVRGNGTVFYRSNIEPWADELGGRDPGFDPLTVACREAHKRRLALHAWVNVMPGWRGKGPPRDPRQLYVAHPDWFWRDASGRLQPFGWYNSLNPCYPEVRRYLVAVMREIVERYPIDGLHMDYIRFPNEWHESYAPRKSVPDYPRDRRTLALFYRATKETPQSSPAKWNGWRTEQVTQVVRDIRAMMRHVRPRAQLSAAVGADADVAKRLHFQDAPRWIAEGLLDAVFPMNYAEDMGSFGRRLARWKRWSPSIPVITGVMFDRRNAETIARQVRLACSGRSHFSAFAYNSLFERLDRRGRPIQDSQSSARDLRRRRVIPVIARRST